MMRLISFLGVSVLCAAAVSVPSAQSAAQAANNEPHHKRLLYTNDVRIFDVTIPPGEVTADHVHEYDMAILIIGDGTLRISRNGQDVAAPAPNARGSVIVTEHTGAPATYRVQNTGTTDYHALEVENVRDDGKWLMPMPMTVEGASVLQQTRAFTIYDERLKPDMGEVRHTHTWSTIAILVDGTFEQGGIGGEEPVLLRQPGRWITLPRAASHTVKAVGGDTHIIEIEAR
jgi:quercetin dioxygenase-like cupin family protein